MVATTLCVSGAALKKAGINVNARLSAGSILEGTDFIVDTWIAEAEGMINSTTRKNWIDNYSTLNTDVKYLLQKAASSLAAMQCISYDMSAYTSSQEAQTMLNYLRDDVSSAMQLLKDKNVEDFIVGA